MNTPPPYAPAMPGPPKKSFPVWAIVLIIVVPVVIFVVSILATLAIYGVNRYLQQAKAGEGRTAVGQLARGVAACAASNDLPPTSPKVPASVSDVGGKKYQSSAADWSDGAFRCARFAMTSPQYFQYQWVLDSPSSGRAIAISEFVTYEQSVRCTPGVEGSFNCTTDPVVEKH